MPGNFRKRMEKLEQLTPKISKRDSDAKCSCRSFTMAATAEYFKAEMKQTCPVHGFRRLGKINIVEVEIVSKEGIEDKSVGVAELAEEYERRLARHQKQLLSRNDDEQV